MKFAFFVFFEAVLTGTFAWGLPKLDRDCRSPDLATHVQINFVWGRADLSIDSEEILQYYHLAYALDVGTLKLAPQGDGPMLSDLADGYQALLWSPRSGNGMVWGLEIHFNAAANKANARIADAQGKHFNFDLECRSSRSAGGPSRTK